MRLRWFGVGWTFLVAAGMGFTQSDAADSHTPGYNRDIRPILSDNCFACHGPDQRNRKAKLRLDIRENAIAKEAIVPGNPEKSELVRRIFATDEDDLMPPPKSHKTLTAAQKEKLRLWVADGARYEGHWAYIPPTKPPTPAGIHPIDALVEARLAEAGLQPSPEADRRTLVRRLHFDLVGLPPKPSDVDSFESDSTPEAYGKWVDRLLSSPQYGERMAVGWLDVVRYADTIGYHSDNPRNIWPYRDYVIKAFNENKPFDEFTREQLAGDLLTGSTLEQKVASGFNRLLLSTEEGGAQPKDYEARMLTDRVRAVGAVWLGQTLGCAQCHDHKFDPITARDFYSMGAFFADIKEPILGPRETGLVVPNQEQAATLTRLNEELGRWKAKFETPRHEMQARWEDAARETLAWEPQWTPIQPEQVLSETGTKLRVEPDGTILVEKDGAEGADTFRMTIRPGLSGIAGIRLEALAADNLPSHGPGRRKDGSFKLTEFTVEDAAGRRVEIAAAAATFESADSPAKAAIDGALSRENGWSAPGLPGVSQTIYFTFLEPVDALGDDTLTLTLTQAAGSNSVLGRFRIGATREPLPACPPKATLPPSQIAGILEKPCGERSEADAEKLAAYYRSVAPELADLRAELAGAVKARDEFESALPHCLVSIASDKPRVVRILPRGDFMNETGPVVQPALPAYLVNAATEPTAGKSLTRLDLAEWLVSRDNPLTARVVMNRLWKQFFGLGLSKVLDDFGSQGEVPPNQPLLDWLACEFMDSGWDMKHMVRLIVTSRTYRQVSTASKELQERDPYNRELARQSRWRLEAEQVRDNALAIAGLLATTRVGGPSVKPYQPDGYWENLNFPVRTYEASPGADQYRRGLYTWWQRSYLHPSLLAFDAPTREECAAERARSNIPQQALVLLNDPTYVEAARVFAARILQEGGDDLDTRLRWAWRETLSRLPREDELRTASDLVKRELSIYRENGRAPELLKVGNSSVPACLEPAELAAWTSVARVLLNLHETITRS